MKRRKRARTSRKDFPLSIDLKDFIMYSNPSKFAPKVRKTGGEAYPQAPTMNQFYNYGAQTPQTPFVFQDGGDMSEVDKMDQMLRNHYGDYPNFNQTRPNRGMGFLQKLKQLSYDNISQQLMDSAYNDDETEDQQTYADGGLYQDDYTTPDFSNASQWYDAGKNNNIMDRAFNAASYGAMANAENPFYYDKVTKNEQRFDKPMAQEGLPFKYGIDNVVVHKSRRWARPENKLKSYTVNYNIYDDQNHLINPRSTAVTNPSATSQQGSADGSTNQTDGSANAEAADQTNMDPRKTKIRGNFLGNLFSRKDNYREPTGDVDPSTLEPQEYEQKTSNFDPRGYNSAYSDFRNQIFQNRRRRIGQRLDELASREHELQTLYNQNLPYRDQNKYNRLLTLYNNIGEGRIPNMLKQQDPSGQFGPIPFNFGNDYQAPSYAYGGHLKHYEEGDQVNDPFGTAGYSTDGYDTTEREDYAGNTIYETPPQMQKIGQGSVTIKNKRKPKLFGKDAFYAGLNFLAAPDQNQKQAQGRDRFSASNVFTQNDQEDQGDWEANYGYFRQPDQGADVQNTGYNFKSPYAKMGGSYKKGGEYYLTQDEIDEIIQNGGQVEFLD